MKKFLIIGLILSLNLVFVLPAQAELCRTIDNHSICILSIKRSAKNYWEYRASVRIDQVTYPIEVYNCRKQIKIQSDGQVIPFKFSPAGKLICHYFKQ